MVESSKKLRGNIMNGKNVLLYLKKACRLIDEGKKPQPFPIRKALVPIALPAAFGLVIGVHTGCGSATALGTDREEICDDAEDNDGDHLIDCDDPDCADLCLSVEEACQDGLDNDNDGDPDCSDEDCYETDYCQAIPPYMAPPEWECDDDLDNDYDLRVDCDDPDCAEDEACNP